MHYLVINPLSPGDDDGAEVLFLRGNLHVRVIRAEGLPDTDRGIFNLVGKDKTDPFVSGALGAARIFKTRVIDNDLNPEWDETFSVGSAHYSVNHATFVTCG